MAPFFAERIWRHRFPYLINTPEKKWGVLKDGDITIGFSSYTVVRKGIELGEIYGLTEEIWMQLALNTLKKIATEESSLHLYTDVKKENSYEWQFFQHKGFKIYKETTHYIFLKRNDEWKKLV